MNPVLYIALEDRDIMLCNSKLPYKIKAGKPYSLDFIRCQVPEDARYIFTDMKIFSSCHYDMDRFTYFEE